MSNSIRIATGDDLPRIVPVVNAAFAVETFFEVPRTDGREVAQLMQTGRFLILDDDTVLEDDAGHVMASIYVELAVNAATSACWLSTPRGKDRASVV